jgi:ribonuclease J
MLLGKTNAPGVDLGLPDWSAYADRLADIDAIVLTHGHEDHIGALPYLLRSRPDIPLIGSRLTLALVAAKLEQHRLRPDLRIVREGDRLTVGEWDLQFYAVNHSIPDALAVALRTSSGTVLHTGDFKMDQTPLDGRITDLPGSATRGWTCCCRTPPMPRCPASSRASARSARWWPTSSPGLPDG